MLDRIKVLINDLKVLGEKVEDKDFSHKFMRAYLVDLGCWSPC
jgi:hypothetical protein